MGKGFECCLVLLLYYGWIELIMVRVSCSCGCGCSRKGLMRVEDAWWGGLFPGGVNLIYGRRDDDDDGTVWGYKRDCRSHCDLHSLEPFFLFSLSILYSCIYTSSILSPQNNNVLLPTTYLRLGERGAGTQGGATEWRKSSH